MWVTEKLLKNKQLIVPYTGDIPSKLRNFEQCSSCTPTQKTEFPS